MLLCKCHFQANINQLKPSLEEFLDIVDLEVQHRLVIQRMVWLKVNALVRHKDETFDFN